MMQKYRVISLVLVHVLILFHIYVFGDEIVGSLDFQEFFHSFIKTGMINSGVVLVFIAFISTLIFGRFFCGWACHFGAIQEFSWIILNKIGVKPKTINSRLVFFLPLFVLINFYIFPNIHNAVTSSWEIGFKMNEPDIWRFLPGFTLSLLTFFIDGFLIVYLLGRKGFCRFICPWGAFLKLPNIFALFKVRKTGNCIKSNNCTTNCPVGIDVSQEINLYDKVTNSNCTSCMICTEGCPTNALSYSYLSPTKEKYKLSYFTQHSKAYADDKIKEKFQSIRKHDIFTFLLTLILFYCIHGLYGMGDFLALGIAVIFGILFFKTAKNKKAQIIIGIIIISVFSFHGIIQWNMFNGYRNFDKENFSKSTVQLETAASLYPVSDTRIHYYLSKAYVQLNDLNNAEKHIKIAQSISPESDSIRQVLRQIQLKKNFPGQPL